MEIYRQAIFPILARMDPEKTHERTIHLLEVAQYSFWGQRLIRQIAGEIPSIPKEIFGLTFPNVIGIAAGYDKDARAVSGLAQLGFGHVEVGTLTPRPQVGNERPRIFRLREDQALINRMGFPNGGVQSAKKRLTKLAELERKFVIGVSLGKQKETPLELAVIDYQKVMDELYTMADYMVINVSSPNTPGLRKLQAEEYLGQLLIQLVSTNASLAEANSCDRKPLLLKIAPDLSWSEIDKLLEIASDQCIDGIIAANTTLSREDLSSSYQLENGGLSGKPLFKRSLDIVSYIFREFSGKMPVIGAGGVSSAGDVKQMLASGASLVQIYTGLVYQGPQLAGRILRALERLPAA